MRQFPSGLWPNCWPGSDGIPSTVFIWRRALFSYLSVIRIPPSGPASYGVRFGPLAQSLIHHQLPQLIQRLVVLTLLPVYLKQRKPNFSLNRSQLRVVQCLREKIDLHLRFLVTK